MRKAARTARKLICLTLVLLPMLLASCSEKPTAGMVRLKSEIELRQEARENCPPCTFVRLERQQYKNICHFTDDTCGFAFTISSGAYKPEFDGFSLGYVENTFNSWDESYYDYVTDTIKEKADSIAAKYGFTIEKLDTPPTRSVYYLHTDRTLEQISEGMIQLGMLIKRTDVHHKYKKGELWAKHRTERNTWEEFAFYRFKDDVTDVADNSDIYYYMDSAEEQLGVKCIFDRKAEMKEGEIPGLSSWKYYDTADDNRVTSVYFFHTEAGQKKLIANYQTDQNVYYIADAE